MRLGQPLEQDPDSGAPPGFGVNATISPADGTDTRSVPSGAQAASRARGNLAHTDIDQPAGHPGLPWRVKGRLGQVGRNRHGHGGRPGRMGAPQSALSSWAPSTGEPSAAPGAARVNTPRGAPRPSGPRRSSSGWI